MHAEELTGKESTRLALLEQSIEHINQTMQRLELSMNSKFDKLDTKIDSNFKWLLMIIVGLSGVMAHGFHWF
jgi:hypothetical protein